MRFSSSILLRVVVTTFVLGPVTSLSAKTFNLETAGVADIHAAVDAGADELKQGVRQQLDARLVDLMDKVEHEATASANNITLRKMASLAGLAAEPPPPPGVTAPAEIVVDGKQPGVG